MFAFDVWTEDESLRVVIFARGDVHVMDQFIDHHLAMLQSMPGAFSLIRRTIKREENKEALREALRRNQPGLGMFMGDRWEIEPIPEMPIPEACSLK